MSPPRFHVEGETIGWPSASPPSKDPRGGESGINGLVWWLRGIFGLEFNRFPYAKRSWPNAAHSATRRGQMRGMAPHAVAKCGAAAHWRVHLYCCCSPAAAILLLRRLLASSCSTGAPSSPGAHPHRPAPRYARYRTRGAWHTPWGRAGAYINRFMLPPRGAPSSRSLLYKA